MMSHPPNVPASSPSTICQAQLGNPKGQSTKATCFPHTYLSSSLITGFKGASELNHFTVTSDQQGYPPEYKVILPEFGFSWLNYLQFANYNKSHKVPQVKLHT